VAGGLLVVGSTMALIGSANVLLLVFVALLLGSALRPLVDRVRARLPVSRGPAILLVYATFFSVVIVVGLLVVPLVINQVNDLAAQLPGADQRLHAWAAALQPPALASAVTSLVDAARSALNKGPAPGPGQVINVGLSVASAVVSVVTILALVFFWMTERQRLQRFVLSFLPLERRGSTREAWNIVELRLGAWVRGQLALMTALGLMTGIAYTALGLPSGPLLGLIAGLAEAIPLIGPALGVIPALLIAAAFRPDLIWVVLVVYVVIQLVESNVLAPLVMRNAVGVSPFLLTVSLLVGGALGGLLGAVIAVPIVAALEAILERLQDRDLPVAQDATSSPAVLPTTSGEASVAAAVES
jgi:predicted PurR-regulated permease PerM